MVFNIGKTRTKSPTRPHVSPLYHLCSPNEFSMSAKGTGAQSNSPQLPTRQDSTFSYNKGKFCRVSRPAYLIFALAASPQPQHAKETTLNTRKGKCSHVAHLHRLMPASSTC